MQNRVATFMGISLTVIITSLTLTLLVVAGVASGGDAALVKALGQEELAKVHGGGSWQICYTLNQVRAPYSTGGPCTNIGSSCDNDSICGTDWREYNLIDDCTSQTPPAVDVDCEEYSTWDYKQHDCKCSGPIGLPWWKECKDDTSNVGSGTQVNTRYSSEDCDTY